MKKIIVLLFMVLASFILIACEKEDSNKQFDVIFKVDDAVYSEQKVLYLERVTLPENPTKDGYEFEYWLHNDQAFDINTRVTENITLTASFKDLDGDGSGDTDPVVKHTVLVYDGMTVISTIKVESGKTISLSSINTDKSGLIFKGWFTDSSFQTSFNVNTPITSDLSIYGKWEELTTGEYLAYYKEVQGLTGTSLLNGLTTLLRRTANIRSYGGSLNTPLIAADKHPTLSGMVYTIYDGEAMKSSASGSSGASVWNKEHVIPKSWYINNGYAKNEGDVHNLRISRASINSTRGNQKFTTGSGAWKSSGGFYPGDDHIGDVARIAMYMMVMMPDVINFNTVMNNGKATILQWHQQDPVDQFEINRNNVLANFQGNRNPFIDHPEMALLIWGSSQTSNELDYVLLNQTTSIFDMQSNIQFNA